MNLRYIYFFYLTYCSLKYIAMLHMFFFYMPSYGFLDQKATFTVFYTIVKVILTDWHAVWDFYSFSRGTPVSLGDFTLLALFCFENP